MPDDAGDKITKSGARGLFDDFSGYRSASDEDYQHVLFHGMITLDTNVLLDLYRQHKSAADQLFEAMECLGDRIWFSHQVLEEFHRNRVSAASDPADDADKALTDLGTTRQQALERFRTWARRAGLSSQRENALQRLFEQGFDALRTGIEEVLSDHDPEIVTDTGTDPVLARLEPIVKGRRGAPMEAATYAASIAEGRRRVTQKIPPGYRDAAKDRALNTEGATGDYLVWEQFLTEAAARRVDGLFVTRDVKPDWFRVRAGETLGPRNELAEEYCSRTGKRLFMLRASSWLHHMKPLLAATTTSTGTDRIDSAAEALEVDAVQRDPGWSRSAVQRLVDELGDAYPVQRQAIQEAYQNSGYVSREQIYSIAGYDPERSLRGFTRPIERLARILHEDGLVPYYAEQVLTPVYNFADTGNNRAVGFSLSEGFSSAYSDAFATTPVPEPNQARPIFERTKERMRSWRGAGTAK